MMVFYSAKSHDIRENVMLRARRTVRIVFCDGMERNTLYAKGPTIFRLGFRSRNVHCRCALFMPSSTRVSDPFSAE